MQQDQRTAVYSRTNPLQKTKPRMPNYPSITEYFLALRLAWSTDEICGQQMMSSSGISDEFRISMSKGHCMHVRLRYKHSPAPFELFYRPSSDLVSFRVFGYVAAA